MDEQGQDGEFSCYRLTRRDFLAFCGASYCLLSLSCLLGFPRSAQAQPVKKGLIKTQLSPWFTKLSGKNIRCDLCPRQCRISSGKRGYCRVRENREGECYSLVFGNPSAFNLDPIEKIAFYHVLPSSMSLTLATVGCNFKCRNCQSWPMSQASPEDAYNYDAPPETVVTRAREMGARSVAYAYVEPVVSYEYVMATAYLARKAGLLNVIHSNGFINPAPLEEMCEVIDAANIDLKGFSDSFYREISDGSLAPVLETMRTLKKRKVHLEITNLVIPTMNDNMSGIREMCRWIREELGKDIPVQFLRFYPLYKLTRLPPTPVSTLEMARSVALNEGLEYVYIGNLPGHAGENTFCPKCGKKIIQRAGYMVIENHVNGGKCGYCGKPIPGIWS